MKRWISLIPILLLAGCATGHWEKAGASEDEYKSDLNRCKGASYPLGADGMVTREMLRRMEGCMEAHGWHKTGG